MTRLFAGTPFDIPPTCDLCGAQVSDCLCTPSQRSEAEQIRQRAADRVSPESQIAFISVQNRKGGRQVTVIEGLAAKANDLPDILAKLQSVCGAGGTVRAKENQIELQGDHAAKVGATLAQMGFGLRK